MAVMIGFKSFLQWSPGTGLEQELPPNLCLNGHGQGVCSLIGSLCECLWEFQVEDIICCALGFNLEFLIQDYK